MKQQEKDSVQHLTSSDAVEKMKELVDHNKICLFVTQLTDLPLQARPMSTQEVDDEGNFWFLSSKSSNKNFEIGEDSRVQLFFSNQSNSEYLSVYGHAQAFRDRNKIEEIWTPIAKAWFQDGKDDQDLSVIKVTPEEAYYWDTKNNKAISLLKIAASVVSGRTMDDGVEGTLKVRQ